MATTSNDQGRALEYCLANVLLTQLPCQIHDLKTQLDQQRDQLRFQGLPAATQTYYQQQCQKVARWIGQNRLLHLTPPLTLRRLTDEEATQGNPTDIEIRSGDQRYNVSLKHNHHAVKHQRPASLYAQLGIVNPTEEQYYRDSIKIIETRFYQQASTLSLHALEFNQVKSHAPAVIDQLYQSICQHVADALNHHAQQARYFFAFLVGNTAFDKIIITSSGVEIVHFDQITAPTTMQASLQGNNYILLTFDNQFTFRMRIHTASSRFEYGKALSLKFDTQLTGQAPICTTRLP
jgi:hypothetical protein